MFKKRVTVKIFFLFAALACYMPIAQASAEDEKAFAILDNAKRMGAVERSNFDGTSYLDKLANTKVGEHSHETLIDAMLSDKRIFFTLINRKFCPR